MYFSSRCTILWSIDHLHNGDRFKYSFMCILTSLLGLIQVQRFYSITDTETRRRRLIKMHIKEYLNRSPLWKWSIKCRKYFAELIICKQIILRGFRNRFTIQSMFPSRTLNVNITKYHYFVGLTVSFCCRGESGLILARRGEEKWSTVQRIKVFLKVFFSVFP